MFKDLEELQINDCQTDICLVGAGGVKVFNQRTMLFADHVHVQPDSVWCQLDPGGGEDGKVVVFYIYCLFYEVILLNSRPLCVGTYYYLYRLR